MANKPPKQAASFIETMDCLAVSKLPDGPEWTYEIKLDGYRPEVVRRGRMTTLYSRRENVLNQRFPAIAAGLQKLPRETVIDGELVALGPDGRPILICCRTFAPRNRAFSTTPSTSWFMRGDA